MPFDVVFFVASLILRKLVKSSRCLFSCLNHVVIEYVAVSVITKDGKRMGVDLYNRTHFMYSIEYPGTW